MTDTNATSAAVTSRNSPTPMTEHPTDALVTTAMIEAGMDAFNANLDGPLSSDLLLEDCVRNIYLAMNAARTTPIAEGEAMPDITDDGWQRTLDDARKAMTTPINSEGPPSLDTMGWSHLNPDAGREWSPSHPIESGECDDAEDIEQMSLAEFYRRFPVVEPHLSMDIRPQDGRMADATGPSQAEPEDVSAPRASVPCAEDWLANIRDALADIEADLSWCADNGYNTSGIVRLEPIRTLTMAIRTAAQAMETREGGDVEQAPSRSDDSAVAATSGDAPTLGWIYQRKGWRNWLRS